MPKLKITETSVAKLKAPDPSGKQVIHWDTELRGFGVLCSGVKNSKSFIVQRDIPGGAKGRRWTVGDANTLPVAQAREEAAEVLHGMLRGLDPKDKPKEKVDFTLRAALEAYLLARKDLRPASVAGYRSAIEKHLTKWLDRPLREITDDMVEERHREIATEVSAKTKRADRSGKSTANGTMRSLRVIWNFAAERMPDLPPHPVRRLRRQWYAEPRREGHVNADALPRFYDAVLKLPNAVAKDYLLLLLFTGLRRSEAASLTWEDIDFNARMIRLPAARMKGKRKLDLPMTDFVFDLLTARGALGKDKFVFPANSKSGHIAEPRFALDQACKEAGINISLHDLRRTFITVAEASDISPIALKALVNHSLGGDVTMGYIMLTAKRLRELAQRVADHMKKLCGILEESEVESA